MKRRTATLIRFPISFPLSFPVSRFPIPGPGASPRHTSCFDLPRGKRHPESAAPLIPPRPTLPKLRAAAAVCRACDLWRRGTQTVFGEGARSARSSSSASSPGTARTSRGARSSDRRASSWTTRSKRRGSTASWRTSPTPSSTSSGSREAKTNPPEAERRGNRGLPALARRGARRFAAGGARLSRRHRGPGAPWQNLPRHEEQGRAHSISARPPCHRDRAPVLHPARAGRGRSAAGKRDVRSGSAFRRPISPSRLKRIRLDPSRLAFPSAKLLTFPRRFLWHAQLNCRPGWRRSAGEKPSTHSGARSCTTAACGWRTASANGRNGVFGI